ncbi:uncharacterized protein [Triticum aestivum]|uniref:uncharacterized protein n=1 Tax=Triticum aestivum TaxID=4565 RepID=UPI001D005B8D|nr:uncharacterized protein LOC123129442 [Triticum aestivum]
MASEEEEFLFGSYTEDEEDLAAAEAKEQRARRRAEGEWGIEKVIAQHKERQMELQFKYLERLKSSDYQVADAEPAQWNRWTGALYFLNVLAIKLIKCSVQFPIDVYGHVSVRDDIDAKRVFLFRRVRDHCQKINDAQGAFLSLTGPSRGIVLHSALHIEIDLKIRSLDSERDIEIANCCLEDKVATSCSKVIRSRVAGPLCSVDLTYAPVHEAVEATFKFTLSQIKTSIKRPNGSVARQRQPFNKDNQEHCEILGKITVGISGIAEGVLLYDGSSLVGEGGLIRLQRRVVAAPLWLPLSINTVSRDGKNTTTSVYPSNCGCQTFVVTAASYELEGTIVWSSLYSSKADDVHMGIRPVKLSSQL